MKKLQDVIDSVSAKYWGLNKGRIVVSSKLTEQDEAKFRFADVVDVRNLNAEYVW